MATAWFRGGSTTTGTASVGVATRRRDMPTVGSYGWDGGLGTSWVNDPVEA